MNSWICDGIPKDGKTYPHCSGPHPPCQNFGPDCPQCGLPKEAVVVSKRSGAVPWKIIIALLITLGFLGLIGILGLFLLSEMLAPCPSGQERRGLNCVAAPEANPVTPTPSTPETVTFDPNWLSSGERVLFGGRGNEDRDRGIRAFQAGNWAEAVKFFEKGVFSNRNDPEVQIYLNNARARLAGSPFVIAAVVPVDNRQASAEEMLRGVADAQTRFNDNGGIGGRLVEIVIANDGNDPDRAAVVAQKIASNSDVLGVIGHNSSDSSQKGLAEYEKAGLATISPTSTSTSLVSQVFFRTVPSDRISGEALARYAKSALEISRVAVFYNPNSSYSKSLQEAFETNFESLGGKVVGNIDLSDPNFNAQQEINSLAGQIEAIALFPNTTTTSVAIALARANSALAGNKLLMLGGDALYSSDTLNQGGNAVEGLIVAIPWFARSQPYAQTAKDRWVGTINWRTAASYDATQAMLKALSKNATRETVLENLRSINLSSAETSGNSLKFSNGERLGEPVLVKITPNAPGKPRNLENGFAAIEP